jgi:uncharacterized protein (TIGR02271 family)
VTVARPPFAASGRNHHLRGLRATVADGHSEPLAKTQFLVLHLAYAYVCNEFASVFARMRFSTTHAPVTLTPPLPETFLCLITRPTALRRVHRQPRMEFPVMLHPARNDSFLTGAPVSMSSDEILSLVDEQLSVRKRRVETGRVRIKTVVDEHEEWIQEALEREAISVERVTVDRVVDALPVIRQEGDVLIIPVVEEVMAVEKRLLLKEEIHVRTQRHVEQVDSPVTLKSTRAVIERE